METEKKVELNKKQLKKEKNIQAYIVYLMQLQRKHNFKSLA